MSQPDMDPMIDMLPAHPTGDRTSQRPVDLVYLARRTVGGQIDERELLLRFRAQSGINLTRLKEGADLQTWRAGANAMQDVARSIGAWNVARIAADAATLEGAAIAASRAALIAALEHAIDEANGFIRTLLV